MISTNSSWDAKNGLLAKKPIYVFAIGGQSTVYTTHDLSREGVTGTLPDYQPWLRTPSGSTQSIDVQAGTSSIGELECVVVDKGGAVRTLVGTTTLEGQTATLRVGYPGIAYSEFVTLNVYLIYKILPGKGYGSFSFRSRDVQVDAKRKIYAHPTNGEVLSEANPWVLQGTPCEVIQAVWLAGLGADVSAIDRTGLVAFDSGIENIYGCVRPYRFSITEPFVAKQFLESQIYKTAGMYPIVDNLGRLGVKPFRAPAGGASAVFAFTDDNCIVLPDIDRAPILNSMAWSYDKSAGGDYGSTSLFVDATSLSLFGRSNGQKVQSDGLRSELGAAWWTQEVSARMFARFAGSSALRGGAPVVSIDAFYLSLPVWVGDYVSLSNPLMPDLFTGALGVTDRLYEVVDRTPAYDAGRMKFKLLDTGLTGAAPAAVYGSAVIGTATFY